MRCSRRLPRAALAAPVRIRPLLVNVSLIDKDLAEGQTVCISGGVSKCDNGQFTQPQQCAGGLQCVALPLVNSKGTSVTCDTEADATSRIAETGAAGGINGSS
jgi:hypothetical protein